MCYALRPEGVEWPMVEDARSVDPGEAEDRSAGQRPSFRLQDLANANGIGHEDAHDALADVRATIELARRIRTAQPRLFNWSLELRNKQKAKELLNPASPAPVVHTSGRIPSVRGCTTVVLPLATHPENDKAIIVFDLMGDADALIESDAEAIRDRVFTSAADLPENLTRFPLKAVKLNAVPMLAPISVLAGVDHERIGLDMERCKRNAELILRHLQTVQRSVREAFSGRYEDQEVDPDLALYSGGFFEESDRRLMNAIRRCTPAELSERNWEFIDRRLPLMLLRYRARNWPDTLSASEWQTWLKDREMRLTQPPDSAFFGLEAFHLELASARESHQNDSRSQGILNALEAWSIDLGLETNISSL
jgi:exodeoxyribonuclease-1